MDVRERYARAELLGLIAPTPATCAELVALLADDGWYELDDGCAFFDREPTTVFVRDAARESLAKIAAQGWPLIVEALPAATERTVEPLVAALRGLTPEQRVAMPAAAHDAICAACDRFPTELANVAESYRWERAFAARVRAGELETAAQFWRTRMTEHPYSGAREQALQRLAMAAEEDEKPAICDELIGWLETEKYPWYPMSWEDVIQALHALAPLPPAAVERLVASRLATKHPTLVWVLAHYEAAAPAVVAIAVDMLQHEKIGDYVPWMPQSPLDDRRWRIASEALQKLGTHAASARPVLIERLLATNEQTSLMGSLRSRILDVLGDPRALLAEIEPRLAALEASESRARAGREDIVEKNRGEQLRRLIAGRIAG